MDTPTKKSEGGDHDISGGKGEGKRCVGGMRRSEFGGLRGQGDPDPF